MTRLPALIPALVYTAFAAFANPALARPLTEAERAEVMALRDGDMRKLVVHEAAIPAPDTVFTDPEGAEMSLADSDGRIRLVNFWATWCAPCRAEMPYLEAVYAKHADEGLVVLGVNVQEPTAVVAPYLDELGLTFPVLLDLDGDVSRLYRVGSYPTSVLVDREGRIVTIRRGAFVNEPDINLSLSMIMPELD